MARAKKRTDWAGTASELVGSQGTSKRGKFAVAAVRAPVGVANQPLAEVQWTPRDELHANHYNPNKVATPEMQLLKTSILEDGWTQPIVARPDGEIVDGFHRWTVSADPEVAALTGGLVPVVRLREVPLEHQMMSTIRHNRARGNHLILNMAEIVRNLIDEEGMTREDVMMRLGMEWEEVDRLYDRGGILGASAKTTFNKAWIPD